MVTKAQYAVQKIIVEGESFELWLDGEVNGGGQGIAFLDWLCDCQYKPNYLLIITLGLLTKDAMVKKAIAENIQHSVWAGPFG